MTVNPSHQRKLETLLAWQEEADKQANRLIVLLLVICILYNYYGLFVPLISSNRLEQIQVAKVDLVHVISQFEVLSSIYGRMANLPPSGATQDMRIFQDQIIPSLRPKVTTGTERLILSTLEDDMRTLTDLYNAHLNHHPRDIADLKHPPDDPTYELDLLLKLDQVIQDMQHLAATNEDVTLCELARDAFSHRSEQQIIRLGNSLTDTFSPYKQFFGRYSSITSKLQFAPSQGLASYKVLKNLIAPPFEVRSIDDLTRLRAFSQDAYEKGITELEQNIEVPIIKASFDRTIIISVIPALVVLLLHLINSYFSRSFRVLAETTKDRLSVFSKEEFISHGPHFYLTLRDPLDVGSNLWIHRLTCKLRTVLSSIIKIGVIVAPSSVCFVYFSYVWNRPTGFVPQSVVFAFGILVTAFTLVESTLLHRQWLNLYNNKE